MERKKKTSRAGDNLFNYLLFSKDPEETNDGGKSSGGAAASKMLDLTGSSDEDPSKVC